MMKDTAITQKQLILAHGWAGEAGHNVQHPAVEEAENATESVPLSRILAKAVMAMLLSLFRATPNFVRATDHGESGQHARFHVEVVYA